MCCYTNTIISQPGTCCCIAQAPIQHVHTSHTIPKHPRPIPRNTRQHSCNIHSCVKYCTTSFTHEACECVVSKEISCFCKSVCVILKCVKIVGTCTSCNIKH